MLQFIHKIYYLRNNFYVVYPPLPYNADGVLKNLVHQYTYSIESGHTFFVKDVSSELFLDISSDIVRLGIGDSGIYINYKELLNDIDKFYEFRTNIDSYHINQVELNMFVGIYNSVVMNMKKIN